MARTGVAFAAAISFASNGVAPWAAPARAAVAAAVSSPRVSTSAPERRRGLQKAQVEQHAGDVAAATLEDHLVPAVLGLRALGELQDLRARGVVAVSYTHLTLPTS